MPAQRRMNLVLQHRSMRTQRKPRPHEPAQIAQFRRRNPDFRKCSVTTKNSQPLASSLSVLFLPPMRRLASSGFTSRASRPAASSSSRNQYQPPLASTATGVRVQVCPNNHAIRVFHGLPALVAPPALSHPHLRKRSSAHVRRIRYTFSLLQYLLLCSPHLGRFSPKTAGVTAALSCDHTLARKNLHRR